MIRSITERTGCKIEIHDDGRVDIASTDEAAARQAVEIVKELTAEAELGKTYVGKVVRVVNFGAFVEILPGVEGLLHISEIADRRIGEVRDVLDEGDETLVKVIDIDAQGRVRLSRRAVLQEKEGGDSEEPVPVGSRGGRDRERGRQGRPPRQGGGGRNGPRRGGQGRSSR
jgi:polyribonucleotide nucleotidyltransferase